MKVSVKQSIKSIVQESINLKTGSAQDKIDDKKLKDYYQAYYALYEQGFVFSKLPEVKVFVNDMFTDSNENINYNLVDSEGNSIYTEGIINKGKKNERKLNI